jgi:hypothetical protein
MKQVGSYEWEDIGIEHVQYFTGRGVAFSSYQAVYVGVGDDAKEAMEDALESASQDDWNVEDVSLDDEMGNITVESYMNAAAEQSGASVYDEDIELYYHVALYLSENPQSD